MRSAPWPASLPGSSFLDTVQWSGTQESPGVSLNQESRSQSSGCLEQLQSAEQWRRERRAAGGPRVSCGGPRRLCLRARLWVHRARLSQAYQVEAGKGRGARQQPELSSADPAGEGGSSPPKQHLHIQTRPRGWPQGEAPPLGPGLLMNLMPSSGQIHRGSKKLGQVRGTWGNSGLPHAQSMEASPWRPSSGWLWPVWKGGREQNPVSLTHRPHSLFRSAVFVCDYFATNNCSWNPPHGSTGPAVWPCAALPSPQPFDPEVVFFEPAYVLVTHHNLAFEILSASRLYSCFTNYTAKPHS